MRRDVIVEAEIRCKHTAYYARLSDNIVVISVQSRNLEVLVVVRSIE